MNQDIDGATILNSGNYKILFGRQFYTNTRMGINLVFEYKSPYIYIGQNCNNEENKQIEQNPRLRELQIEQHQMRHSMRCSSIKYNYLYLTINGLQYEESINQYPDIPNPPQSDQLEYQNKQLKFALFRLWKIVMIIDETIINNINKEYQKSKEEFFAKMKQLKEMRMKQNNISNRN